MERMERRYMGWGVDLRVEKGEGGGGVYKDSRTMMVSWAFHLNAVFHTEMD